MAYTQMVWLVVTSLQKLKADENCYGSMVKMSVGGLSIVFSYLTTSDSQEKTRRNLI